MSATRKNKPWVVFLSTYPPRECGIATFTQDLSSTFNHLYTPGIESKVVAMNVDDVHKFNYSKKVIGQINQSKVQDYIDAANQLNNLPQVKLVNIQHEFGIFGEDWGSNLLPFLETIKKPVVVTFHTVLPEPDSRLAEVVNKILAKANTVVVFTKLSRNILLKYYQADKTDIQIIPHGIHSVPFTDGKVAKAAMGFTGRTVLSSFGLLSEGKGLEYVLDSLPAVVKKFPKIISLIIGATHPLVVKKDGEKYRNFLTKKIYDLKLADHVKFYDRYLELDELLEFLKATDVYISPSLNPNQAVSGTLSYAMGTGRAIVSTAFAQAQEDITPNVGLLVDFKKPEQYTQALIKLLSDNDARHQMGKTAYFNTRNMTWPNVAISYMRNFVKLAPDLGLEEKHLPKLKLKHLVKMTDDFGMLQFAKMAEPDPASGYTVDDNARALIFAVLCYEKHKTPSLLKLISTYLNFVEFVAKPNGFFDNYVNYDRTFNVKSNSEENLEDASARALYALAVTARAKAIPAHIREKAKNLFWASAQKEINFTHLRSSAFYVKGLALWLNKWRDAKLEAALIQHCDQLSSAFNKNATPEWQWFEDVLTYANAVIPEALLCAYSIVGENKKIYFNIGKAALDFLISQTFKHGLYHPIGQRGWYPKDGKRADHDQQPEDASYMIQALKTMHDITGEESYRKLMHQAFTWYLGGNTLHQVVYDETTGGCNDGVGDKYLNLNQGAESTVSYLTARLMFL